MDKSKESLPKEDVLKISFKDRIFPKEEVSLLKGIQGNILKKNGGENEALLLLSFGQPDEKEVTELRKKIRSLADKFITNGYQQLESAHKRKEKGPQETFTGFYLSYSGYIKLGIAESEIPKSASFRSGMENADLGDPSRDEWETVWRKGIDAIILIIDDNLSDIENRIKALSIDWETYIAGKEVGTKLKNVHDQTIEHFGYVDGISQPLFFDKEVKEQRRDHWDPSASKELVLEKEAETDHYGSYLVYRKLEQNVHAFKEAEERLAHTLGFAGETEEVAGALMIGRFENGLPVIKFGSTTDPEEPSEDNDFQFDIDKDGASCPFHAHIRKTNPRGDSQRQFGEKKDTEREHRIARRGITYDYIGRNGDMTYHPERGVGLLFMCFQSSLENQFEFMQKNWANNNDFPRPFTGIDPVIGQGQNRSAADGQVAEQKWTDIRGKQQCASLQDFVTMKGGGYFYAPSIHFLKNI